ncbi:olfactory receptor 14A2-like isoform X1 [Cricetulus griseus]|uniref:olfactory receptor 14A2-like isoform X1 n=1 Tax=Cricetulus griseus TaxID=10029 RepID=UPI0007DA4DB9|nr:olfactory receptor 14A2-like isoform X1 [Cricetulus griseus]
MSNVTAITGFILMGFSDIHELETLCGVTFLLTYLLTLMSNFLTITLITLDLKLQSPMYFFLKNLSLLDIFLVSVTIPNFFVHSLTYNNSISTLGCACQVFFMASFGSGEVFVLTVMSYDRYVAVCSPLHYDAIMNNVTCMLMMGASWSTALLLGVMYTAAIFSMPFCGSNVISQIFCDVPSLLRILCTPTSKGQSKAFATCIPHLTVFTVFIATACIVYLKPPSNVPSITDRLFSVLYTVLPPALNPVIYSLRNNDVKCALRRLQILEKYRQDPL